MSAEGLISVVAEELLKAAISLAVQEIGIARAFKGELETLRESMNRVRGFLQDAEERQVTDASVKVWLQQLTDFAYRARDAMEELEYENLRYGVETQGMVSKKVINFFSVNNPSLFRQTMAHKIKGLNLRLKTIEDEAQKNTLQSRLLQMPQGYGLADRETQSSTGGSTIVGRKEEVSQVVKFLTTSSTNHDPLPVSAVVGMPGLGKTTVAQLVFNDQLVKNHFDVKIWLCVSVNFDVKTILRELLQDLGVRKGEGDNLESLAQSLEMKLQGKKCLFVLDDVWNDDKQKWWSLKNCLARGDNMGKGNCILVTTRSSQVASVMEASDTVELEKMSDDECWSIFKEKAFSNEAIPEELKEIGFDLARKCQGVPLAAKVLGGVMMEIKAKEGWLSIQADRIWHSADAKNQILPALKISYDRLSPPPVKQCFAYCAKFDQDHVIERTKLVQLWMAEGFLEQPPGETKMEMEDVGNAYFGILLQNSLFQDVVVDMYGDIVSCKMHDLVHELAQSVHTRNDTPKPRTLEAKDSNWIDQASSGTKCLHYCGLRPVYDVQKLSVPLSELKHLRYVEIVDSYFEEVLPKVIIKLYYLQTLRLKDCHGFEKLWKDLRKLVNLRHIRVDDCGHSLVENDMPIHMGNLIHLQTLPFFVVGSQPGQGIGELGSLEKLGGELAIYHLEKVTSLKEAMEAKISEKGKLKKLKLRWSGSSADDKGVLEGLQPHRNLRGLSVENYQGSGFPTWVMKMAQLRRLVEVRLMKCSKCEKVPMLGHLPCLKVLEIIGLENVSSLGGCHDEFYGDPETTTTVGAFPALRKFKVENMSRLVEWKEPEGGSEMKAFPCLEELIVKNCPELGTFPSDADMDHFSCLEKLEIEGIKSCPQMWKIICKVTSLTSLYVWDVEKMPTSLSREGIRKNNKNLSYMRV